jgi:hypothetical protein
VIAGVNPFAAAVPGSPTLLRAWNAYSVPDRRYANTGDFGVSARWNPDWLDGTMGFYYRNGTDIAPQVLLTPGFAALPAGTCTAIGGIVVAPGACIINPKVTNPTDLTTKGKLGTYQTMYGNNIHFYGLTLAKNIGGVSLGMEFSYRENMPLLSDTVQALPAPLVNAAAGQVATTAVPTNGDTVGAVGNTFHGILNAVGIFGKTELWDTASWQQEFTWMRWQKVTQNMGVFKGRPGYTAIDGVTKDFIGWAVNFTPTWFQVYPGVDLLAPMSFSLGLSGNSAVLLGGQEGAGSFAAGIALDMYQKYRLDLKYTGYLGNYATTANALANGLPAGAVTVYNGTNAILSDRGWVSLTFKTTF